MAQYVIGLDFGTLSGRALLADAATGQELASSVYEYPHGVMDEALPSGKKLGADWALQHPQDYLDVLDHVIPEVLQASGVVAEDVAGIGLDFTSCTEIPVKKDGTPLCFLPEFQDTPHAYVKLWKHHAAQNQATRMTETAAKRGELWLQYYGGKLSSEAALPKLLQVLEEDEAVYNATDRWIEAGDWVIWQLCGHEVHGASMGGYKEYWMEGAGHPSEEFCAELNEKFRFAVQEKLSGEKQLPGTLAGRLTKQAAARFGLKEGTAIAASNIDAHACVPAVGMESAGKMLAIIGTSTCLLSLSNEGKAVPGISGVVKNGVIQGQYAYEAGQACSGDHFDWFTKTCVPASYEKEAEEKHISIHKLLRQKAQKLAPGQSGLLALDWWNGNRSVLSDGDLTGMMLGMTLQTKPEEIYRALIEATAYGARVILENYTENGVPVDELYASGGIPQKDPMMMQIYADVLGRPIHVVQSSQGAALGAAIFAATAARIYPTANEAIRAMSAKADLVYTPIPENRVVYERLFAEYRILHDYFGRGENNVMKHLKAIRQSAEG